MSSEQTTVDFSAALLALKQGQKVARSNWIGEGMHIVHVPETLELGEHFEMKDVNESYGAWVPAVSDILSEDWIILG